MVMRVTAVVVTSPPSTIVTHTTAIGTIMAVDLPTASWTPPWMKLGATSQPNISTMLGQKTVMDWAKKRYPKTTTTITCSAFVGRTLWSLSESLRKEDGEFEFDWWLLQGVSHTTIPADQRDMQESLKRWVLDEGHLVWKGRDLVAKSDVAHHRKTLGTREATADRGGVLFEEQSKWKVFRADYGHHTESTSAIASTNTANLNDTKADVQVSSAVEPTGNRVNSTQKYFIYSEDTHGTATLWCLGRSTESIERLLAKVHHVPTLTERHRVDVYEPYLPPGYLPDSYPRDHEWYWNHERNIARRSIASIYLNPETKSQLIDDIADYLDPATQEWYEDRSIPWRRGYLLFVSNPSSFVPFCP